MSKEKKPQELFNAPQKKGEYLSLPSITFPRIVIPLSSNRSFSIGVSVQNTASVKNRIIKSVIAHLYPLFCSVSFNRITLNENFRKELYQLSDMLGLHKIDFAFYIGTAESANRKLTILLIGESDNHPGLLKYPLAQGSDQFIEHEFAIINRMSGLNFSSIILPVQQRLITLNDFHVLFQENIFSGSRKLRNELIHQIVTAAIELSVKTTEPNKFSSYRHDLGKVYAICNEKKIISMIEKAFNNADLAGIPVVTQHGDFVLYNMQLKGHQIALIDWEYCRAGLPLFDLFHFVFQGSYQIAGRNVSESLRQVKSKSNQDYFKRYLSELGISESLIDSLFILYLADYLLFDTIIRKSSDPKLCHYYKALELLS